MFEASCASSRARLLRLCAIATAAAALLPGALAQAPGPLTPCGPDESRDAACYAESEPLLAHETRAVARILVDGVFRCTGFLVSCRNDLLTTAGCIPDQATLDVARFELDRALERCDEPGAGETSLTLEGGTLRFVDGGLDVALIRLAPSEGVDPARELGWLPLSEDAALVGTEIAIAGHPLGEPRQLSLESSDASDPAGRCTISSVDEPACSGGSRPDLGYACDTDGGSEGSPVLHAARGVSLGLHHCGACLNRGVPADAILAGLDAAGVRLAACGRCAAPPTPTGLSATAAGDNRIELAWNAVAGASGYEVLRSLTGCAEGFEAIARVSAEDTGFIDEEASGGSAYAYRVVALSGSACRSERSACAEASTSGACLLAPDFSGVASVASELSSTCALRVSWAAGSSRCGGALRYNVYRAGEEDVAPSAANLVASCVEGTSFLDESVREGATYRYVVRAEDAASSGAGPCQSGAEDDNAREAAASAEGAEQVLFEDDFESSFDWTLEGEWEINFPRGSGGVDGGGAGPPDPSFAAEGSQMLGHDIDEFGESRGNYEDGLTTPERATSPSFDASGAERVRVRFARWLATEARRYDRAALEAFDGSGWVTLWENPDDELTDGAWVDVSYDASGPLAGNAAGQLRFAQSSDSSLTYGGWNVDRLEVLSVEACPTGDVGLGPVPDGRFTGGAPLIASRGAAAGTVDLSWDVALCPAPAYHLLSGGPAELATTTPTDASCALDVSGTDTVALADPAPGSLTWFVIVAAEGASGSLLGYDAAGAARAGSGNGFCGLAQQDVDARCP